MNQPKELQSLVGFTIIGWQDAVPGDYYSAPTLILLKGSKVVVAEILQDPEGNGPGFLALDTQPPAIAKRITREILASSAKGRPHTAPVKR